MNLSESKKVINKSNRTNNEEGGVLFQSMITHWIHEDNLYWSQVKTLLTIQFALYASWYALGSSILSSIIMFISAAASYYIFRLANTIRKNRDVNLSAITFLANNMAADITRKYSKESDNDETNSYVFKLALHSLTISKDAGYKFQRKLFWVLIIINIILGIIGIYDKIFETKLLSYIHSRFM